jgi:hypothetical protein
MYIKALYCLSQMHTIKTKRENNSFKIDACYNMDERNNSATIG